MPVRRSVRNPKARLILMTAERREAGYRAQNPALRRQYKPRRPQRSEPLTVEQRLANYKAQNAARGVALTSLAQLRQLAKCAKRATWKDAKTDA